MRVIIDIPNAFFNGIAGLFAMQSPEDTGVIMAAMEKCQSIDEMELPLEGIDDDNRIRASIASFALAKVIGDKEANNANRNQSFH